MTLEPLNLFSLVGPTKTRMNSCLNLTQRKTRTTQPKPQPKTLAQEPEPEPEPEPNAWPLSKPPHLLCPNPPTQTPPLKNPPSSLPPSFPSFPSFPTTSPVHSIPSPPGLCLARKHEIHLLPPPPHARRLGARKEPHRMPMRAAGLRPGGKCAYPSCLALPCLVLPCLTLLVYIYRERKRERERCVC